MFILYNGKFPGVATMVNEEAWPAGVTTGLIPWKLPFHFFFFVSCALCPLVDLVELVVLDLLLNCVILNN